MSKREDYNDGGAPETVVGASVKIEGDLVSEGDIRVEGAVSGKIKTTKNLYVGAAANIEADIDSGNAVIAGQVKGEIKIKDSLLIQETGKVSGNISCGRLSIAEGARFTGSCTMSMPEGGESLSDVLPEEEE
ncbi:MAG: hypothetical protein A2751_02165 [Candidatus Doudnabacteria bacterium RIFCSPHIGHO2_01_FULL_46_14]|uniref:Cell shape determination protein CcmA n=1 Tax=Candidatus Doudnabacteria bacterium RIFCSPHIGHO2_01_FULL_46_14 TaxID=1817824 RepID=A0A1F5NJE4_9BACT|nr:MAG: hypothetical protein A2751_02165 [Candidatus Doudnabacteria bacterium RIFCSPHIGHO2_01_FULL_46_14]